MALHLIIDGYNLIRQSPWLSRLDARDLEEGRRALLECLGQYHRKKPAHRLTVVFDGWQGGEPRENRDYFQGIAIIYSRRGERADEVVKRLAAREGTRAVVVTSDREIQDFAAQKGATWVEAREFESRCLTPTLGAGAPEAEDDPPGPPLKKGPSRRLSKKARQKQQRLRKL
uniref:NYN domain-containing protein n=1 Tax=Desulfobacca acetoxidans TaxID=60893 RepID=A0A7V4G799_9BACT